jgi:hypothetical protein
MTFLTRPSFPGFTLWLVLLLILAHLFFPAFTLQVEADSGIFQYAVWRSNDPIVSAPYVDGVVAYCYWNSLEREPGKVDVDAILRIRARAQEANKRLILRIVTAEHTPTWVYRMGVPEVYEKIDNRFQPVPLYWNPLYLKRLDSLVGKIAQSFDGDPALAAVQIGIATYGEMLLGGREWSANGFTSEQWTRTCQKIIDIYRDHFTKTPLVVMIMSQEFPGNRQTGSMLPVAEYAASRGVGLQFNGLSPDNSYLWGLMDKPDPTSAIGIMRKFRHDVPLYLEMTSDKVDARLSCLNALSERVSFLFVYTSLLDDRSLAPVFEFSKLFLGKNPGNSNAVWTLLRQTFPGEEVRTGKKNYEFGLRQLDHQDLRIALDKGGVLDINAKTSPVERLNGLPCRRTVGQEKRYQMVFKISDSFDPGSCPVLTVIYADIGQDVWFPMYASGDKFISCEPVRKNNTGRWLRADFKLEGFVKGFPIDIVINSNEDGDEFVDFVEITRTGDDVSIPFSTSEVTSSIYLNH